MFQMTRCLRCGLPASNEGNHYDKNGICRACVSAEQKMHIDWNERYDKLLEIVSEYKELALQVGSSYDCMVPISGGKDSFFQLHVLTKVLKLKVLAVTFSHNWYSEIGLYNLWNALESFDVDHIQFTPNRTSISEAAHFSLAAIGDACWHCHSGVGAFPLHVAVKFGIPLLIWGESAAEASGRGTHFEPLTKFDRDYFIKISSKISVCDASKDASQYRLFKMLEPPTAEECEAAGIVGLHLGDYIFWDEEKQTDFIKREYGWKEDHVEGAIKGYKSVECIMPGMHDYTMYLKRGFGRASIQAAADVRQGVMTLSDAVSIAQPIDSTEPEAMGYFSEITGYSHDDIYTVMEKQRVGEWKDFRKITAHEQQDRKSEARRPFVIKFIERIKREL